MWPTPTFAAHFLSELAIVTVPMYLIIRSFTVMLQTLPASGRTSEADATAGGKAISDDQVYVDLEALDAKEAEGTQLPPPCILCHVVLCRVLFAPSQVSVRGIDITQRQPALCACCSKRLCITLVACCMSRQLL